MGEKSAYLTYNAVTRIKEAAYRQAIPRIDPDHLSKDHTKLLETIYKKWELVKAVEALKDNLDRFKKAIAPDMDTLKKQKGFIGSLFQSKAEKEKIKDAFENLNQEKYKKDLENIRGKSDYILRFNVSEEELIQHFIDKMLHIIRKSKRLHTLNRLSRMKFYRQTS